MNVIKNSESFQITNPIYYLLIYDYLNKYEIGNYFQIQNGNLDDFKEIIKYKQNTKYKLKNHYIYKKKIKKTNILYILIVKKNSFFDKNEKLCEDLIEVVEFQGIRNLINNKGELSSIGILTFNFSIEQYIKNVFESGYIEMYYNTNRLNKKLNSIKKYMLNNYDSSANFDVYKYKKEQYKSDKKLIDDILNENNNNYDEENSSRNINNNIRVSSIINRHSFRRENALYFERIACLRKYLKNYFTYLIIGFFTLKLFFSVLKAI